jgi:hypothetical protein
MVHLFTLLLLLTIPSESPEVVQLPSDKEFKLDGFIIRDTYVLNDRERFVIASQLTADQTDFEGLRLLYIKDNKIEFKSKDVGESYIYKPTFYKFKDNSILIVCQQGFEYFIGVDVFEFRNGKINVIGNMDLASNISDNLESVIPNMTIERKYGDEYDFRFKGQVTINPGGKAERKVNGESIKCIYMKETGVISLMIKSK